ncbi:MULTISPECIES: pyrimidine reductase family protein [Streptomyces]|uniref:Pyrimidine reductase family protein n=4 Tax=Streptomyces TaxID=1883 RepID=A0ABU2R3U5_9ACTN|nr:MULTISPECIES: pyrimidine reductase family protein [unclassified Streptomyces]MDT0410084.1 pyrimidine reductase family protein [Streptomyces sp. DSM 41979]SCE57799.1 Pyrimidine reductase, riboflavin biosynthesis [Streptomyces sp. DfronAA-171]
MRRLFPVTDPAPNATDTDCEWPLAELAALYAYPEPLPEAGVLRANMVTTLDGAAFHDGRSQGISGPGDMRVFGVLRALADVVVVGAGTARGERYRPAKAREAFAAARAERGQAPAAAIAVVSASLDLDFTLPLFTEPVVPTLVLTGAEAPAERVAAARKAGAEVVVAGSGRGAEPARLRAELAARGLRRQLAEGGPQLLGRLIAADTVDELCLTVSPFLTAGDASRIAHAPQALTTPARLRPASILAEDGFLFTRYVRDTAA